MSLGLLWYRAALTVCTFASFVTFGNLSRSLVFFMTITRWFPGLITWIFDNSSDPGMQNLRQNKRQGRVVAQKLLDTKRQELKDGRARKDVMSLLGSLLPLLLSPADLLRILIPSQIQ